MSFVLQFTSFGGCCALCKWENPKIFKHNKKYTLEVYYERFVVCCGERYSFDDERDVGDEIDVGEVKTINQRVREDHLEKCFPQSAFHCQSQHQRKGAWPALRDHREMSISHWGPYCSAERGKFWWVFIIHLQQSTYIPISIVISNDSSWVKIQVFQIKVCFDFICKVFVGFISESRNINDDFVSDCCNTDPWCPPWLRGLLCPVPGVLGVAGIPGVWGVPGPPWPQSGPLSMLATASDIWLKGPSSRGYWPETIPLTVNGN